MILIKVKMKMGFQHVPTCSNTFLPQPTYQTIPNQTRLSGVKIERHHCICMWLHAFLSMNK